MKSKKLVLFVLCVSMCSYAMAADLFFENFDGKTTADLKAAGWVFEAAAGAAAGPDAQLTVMFGVQGTRETNPPSERGLPTTGQYIISDADKYGGVDGDENDVIYSGMSHDAITPAINCAGANKVYLSADLSVCLNNNGSAVFMIDVKAGSGDWVTKEVRVAPARFPGEAFAHSMTIVEGGDYTAVPGLDGNMGGVYGRYWVDISDVAAGKSDVKVRFRHYEQDWDWWVAVDNVRVTTTMPYGSETILGPINFANGIPSTWSYDSGEEQEGNAWMASGDEYDTYGAYMDSIRYYRNDVIKGEKRYLDGNSIDRLAGGNYAVYQALSWGDPELEGNMDTPSINCSEYAEVFFYAWMEMLPDTGFNAKVQVSSDGGATFTDLFDYNAGALTETREGSYAMKHYIPVPEAAKKSNVIFRFKGIGINTHETQCSFFAVTDVTITGNKTTLVDTWMMF